MAFNHKVRLVQQILQSQFGMTVATVGVALARKGPSPLSFLVQTTGLGMRTVKEALFVLIHHSLVQYREAGSSEDDSIMATAPLRTLYRLQVGRVIVRLAYPPVVVAIKKEMGDETANLLQRIIWEGRLRCGDDGGEEEVCLKRLLQRGLVEYVTEDSSCYNNDNEEVHHHDESETSIKRLPSTKLSTNSSNIPSPKKSRKTEEDANLTETSNTFVRLRIAGVRDHFLVGRTIEATTLEINQAAGEIVRCIANVISSVGSLEERSTTTFTPFQVGVKLDPSIPLPLHLPKDQESSLSSSTGLNDCGKTPVAHYLEAMDEDLSFFHQDDVRAGGVFRLDWNEALTHVRYELIHSFIRNRFGLPSLRIFCIVRARGMAEEKTISRAALLTPRECRERLYQLLQMGLMALQEVPRTQDHAPSRTFYLWTVREGELMTTMATWYLHAALNLGERLELERRRNALLIAKSERSDVRANPALLTLVEQKQLLELRNHLNRLYFNLHGVAGDSLLFSDAIY